MFSLLLLFKLVLYLILLAFLAVITYCLYFFVVKPYRSRQYYSQFKDVTMIDKFYPFFGDYKVMSQQFIEKGKFIGHYIRDFAFQEGAPKFTLVQWAFSSHLAVNDPETISELEKLVPTCLDRFPIDNTGHGRIGGTGGIAQIPSTDQYKLRRETWMKIMGVNYASRFIPTFIKYLEQNFNKLKEGDTADVSQMISSITFEIICTIIYGKDTEEKLELCNYEDPQGNIQKLNLYECIMSIASDCNRAAQRLTSVLFPLTVEYDIGQENARNTRNNNEIIRVLKNFINSSEDKTSVYHLVTSQLGIDPNETFKDSMAFLVGGHETSSKTF